METYSLYIVQRKFTSIVTITHLVKMPIEMMMELYGHSFYAFGSYRTGGTFTFVVESGEWLQDFFLRAKV